jgi:hypothetical protein
MTSAREKYPCDEKNPRTITPISLVIIGIIVQINQVQAGKISIKFKTSVFGSID